VDGRAYRDGKVLVGVYAFLLGKLERGNEKKKRQLNKYQIKI
jgi:hypothetical protein